MTNNFIPLYADVEGTQWNFIFKYNDLYFIASKHLLSKDEYNGVQRYAWRFRENEAFACCQFWGLKKIKNIEDFSLEEKAALTECERLLDDKIEKINSAYIIAKKRIEESKNKPLPVIVSDNGSIIFVYRELFFISSYMGLINEEHKDVRDVSMRLYPIVDSITKFLWDIRDFEEEDYTKQKYSCIINKINEEFNQYKDIIDKAVDEVKERYEYECSRN